jgi:polyisoprenoid-binding protein YceI
MPGHTINQFASVFRVALFTVLLSSCAQAPENKPVAISSRPIFNPDHFVGGNIYSINPETSYIRIQIYRGGALAHFGHHHIISSQTLEGKIYRHADLEKSGALLSFPVNALTVDDPTLRSKAGPAFEIMPSPKDIAGTRNNMLSNTLLDSEHFPVIQLATVQIIAGRPLQITVRITVKGHAQDFTIAGTLLEKNNQITISGTTQISHQQLGLTPFSIMMGAIAVEDLMDIEFNFAGELVTS